ncbi:MAG: TIGR01212 family radical SAM protein [Bacteroidetes bacterium]|nr:TIGR01212 family radical SAM protein [Bacteroidota bacterium]MBU1717787.1 TIGR01212 family radical SAM protein [Bacteroidota bacterium]
MSTALNHPFFLAEGKRYFTFPLYMKAKFGGRYQKVSVDAGFSCPNRDGTKSTDGCTFCSNDAFNPSYCSPEKPLLQQIDEGIRFHRLRYRRAGKYLAYFQPFSNTNADVSTLRKLYFEALSHPDVHGLVIGTRPDCIDDEKLELLAEIAEQYLLFLEFGIESCHDKTLLRVNRQHSVADAEDAVRKAASRGIHTGAHFILGLPGETEEDMLSYSAFINNLPLNTVKFHQLQLFKETMMAAEYAKNPASFHLFSLEEYTNLIISVLELLRSDLPIERLAGEVPPRFLDVPPWGNLRNDQILQYIERKMEELDTWQGKML